MGSSLFEKFKIKTALAKSVAIAAFVVVALFCSNRGTVCYAKYSTIYHSLQNCPLLKNFKKVCRATFEGTRIKGFLNVIAVDGRRDFVIGCYLLHKQQ